MMSAFRLEGGDRYRTVGGPWAFRRRWTGAGKPPGTLCDAGRSLAMAPYTSDQLKRAGRLKQLVDLAREDLERRQGPGWSKQSRAEAAAYLTHCQDIHKAFLVAIAADGDAI